MPRHFLLINLEGTTTTWTSNQQGKCAFQLLKGLKFLGRECNWSMGHVTGRSERELIKDLLLPTPPARGTDELEAS